MNANDEQHDDTIEEECSDTETQRTTPRSIKLVTKSVDTWIHKFEQMGLEFVTPRSKLIEQLLYFNGKTIGDFKTRFLRKSDGYVHTRLVCIDSVLYGITKIWSDKERQDSRRAINTENHPRGVDTDGNKETDRTYSLIDLFPGIKSRYTFKETVRGSLVDIIVTDKYTHKTFGLQIATAELSGGKFNFNKIVDQFIKCISNNIVILLIAVINGEIVGVYLIPPTLNFKKELITTACKGSMIFKPAMLSKITTSSKLNRAFEQFRYIREQSKIGVKGTVKDLVEFPTDFHNLCDKNPSIVNTPAYLSSLFNGNSECAEWASNVAYEHNVLTLVPIELKIIHGQRGDILAKYDNGEFRFELRDERKILKVCWVHDPKSNSWELLSRKLGHQGLHPSKVDMVTASIRSDRNKKNPNDPKDFPAFIVVPVLTADGDLAFRPDKPSACSLSINYNVAKRDDYFRVKTNRIGANMYPASMQMQDEDDKSMTKIKAVFYYDDLKKPDGKRLRELLELYTMIAERREKIKPSAIEDYETAVNDELIEQEKNNLKKLKESKKKPSVITKKTEVVNQ